MMVRLDKIVTIKSYVNIVCQPIVAYIFGGHFNENYCSGR
jgi:hypothetical protein